MDIPGRRPSSKKRMETAAFVKEIADRMYIPEDTVQAILDVAVEVITEVLLRGEGVIIRRFGVFRIGRVGTAKFKAALALRQILKEKAMEKYGVEMDNETVLLARITGACPACRSPLESKDPPRCPKCGTAPFERRSVDRQSVMVENLGKIYGKPNEEE